MKKADVVEYAKLMSGVGYVTHLGLLDIYDAGDNVPGVVVDLVVHAADERPMVIYGSADLMALLKRNAARSLNSPKK